MTDITSGCTIYYGIVNDIKIVVAQTAATAATSDTIDLGTDTAGGKVNTILNTLLQDDAGADKTATWDPATGIITLGTITTGIHNITVIAV